MHASTSIPKTSRKEWFERCRTWVLIHLPSKILLKRRESQKTQWICALISWTTLSIKMYWKFIDSSSLLTLGHQCKACRWEDHQWVECHLWEVNLECQCSLKEHSSIGSLRMHITHSLKEGHRCMVNPKEALPFNVNLPCLKTHRWECQYKLSLLQNNRRTKMFSTGTLTHQKDNDKKTLLPLIMNIW